MSKKTLRLLVVVMTLVCIVALLFAFAACNKTGGGDDNNNGDNNNGNNGGNTDVNDVLSNVSIKIVPTIRHIGFGTRNRAAEISNGTYYYAPEMKTIVMSGDFNLYVRFDIASEYNGKTLKGEAELQLSTSPSSQGLDDKTLSYDLSKNVGDDITFTLSKLQSTEISREIKTHLLKFGASEEDACKFIGDTTVGKNEEAPIAMPGPIYQLDVCKYIEGYSGGKVTFTAPQIVSLNERIPGSSYTVDAERFFNEAAAGAEPYSSLDFYVFNYFDSSLEDQIIGELKARNGFLKYYDFHMDRDITADNFDSSCTIKDGKVVLDQNELVFRVNAMYQSYTLTIPVGDYFIERYSQYDLPVEAGKVALKYDFEGTHQSELKVKVSVFGQEAEIPVTQTVYGFVPDKTKLPLFFADKPNFARCSVKYNASNTVGFSNIAPDSVRLTCSDADAGTLSLRNMVLTFVYDGAYETSITAQDLFNSRDRFSDAYQSLFVGATIGTGMYEERLFTQDNYGSFVLDETKLAQAFDAPYVYNAINFIINDKAFNLSMSVKLNKTVYSVRTDASLCSSYWQYEDIDFGYATNLTVTYNVGIYRDKYETVDVPLTASLFPSFSTEEVVSEGRQYVVNLDGKDYALGTWQKYTVKQNPVVSIELASDALDGLYVKDEPFEFEPFRATVTFESGLVRTIDVTEDMLSGYDESAAGTQTVTVTYKEGTATKDILVKEVSSLEFYDKNSISDTYLLNETPAELEIKVTFTDGDYDVIALTEQQISDNFDTSSVGSGRFSFTYGGKTISKTFNVVEAAYLYYNVDETTGEADIIGLGYQKTERAYKLTSCSEIEIPSKIGEYTVVSVGAQAFKGANGIKSIVVPETVTEIFGSAFSECTGLKKLVIKGNPTVGSSVVYKCSNLEYLEIHAEAKTNLLLWFQSSVSDSKTYALPATNLTVKFSEGSETIPDNFFNGISEDTPVQKLVLPRSLTSIGDQSYSFEKVVAFEAVQGGSFSVVDGVLFSDECTVLCYYPVHLKNETLVIGDSVVKVGGIMNNPYLKTVVIGQNVAELSENIFTDCTALESVTFRGSLKVIPNWAFARCEALTSFTFPEGLETIGDDAFIHSGLLELIIPDSVTTVGHNAFYSVPVKRIYIPAHLTDFFDKDKGYYDLGWGYFGALETVTYSGSIPLDKLTVYGYGISQLKEAYLTVTVCENWAKNTSWPKAVYALEAVTSVGANAGVYGSYTLLSERSTGITNNCNNVKITYNRTFAYWWK